MDWIAVPVERDPFGQEPVRRAPNTGIRYGASRSYRRAMRVVAGEGGMAVDNSGQLAKSRTNKALAV
jgi:hypothetical protein